MRKGTSKRCVAEELLKRWRAEVGADAFAATQCERRLIECPCEDDDGSDGCDELVRAHLLLDHKRTTCQFARLVCPRGWAKCTFFRYEKPEHDQVCKFWK